jgi:molybdopterin molybdotransferase
MKKWFEEFGPDFLAPQAQRLLAPRFSVGNRGLSKRSRSPGGAVHRLPCGHLQSIFMSENVLSYNEAAALVAKSAAKLARIARPIERVPLARTAGRVLARPLRADRDQPPFARSTRDGFACRAAEASAHAPLRVAGATRAGVAPSGPLARGSAWEIMTGAPVPRGADAVVMLEHVEVSGGEVSGASVRLLPPRTVEAGENIVARGAQARKGEELLPAGTAIGAAQIALAAACGCATVEVFRKPRVAILATGDELVPVDKSPAPGQIRNSNAPMLAAVVAAHGGEPRVLPIARDTANALDAAFARASQADLLLITGGVSAGKFDLVEPALARAGARFHFTGVRIQPGKPTVFAEIPLRHGSSSIRNQNRAKRNQDGTKCFGLPGNPVSSAVTFLLFAAPVLGALAGLRDPGPRFALARLAGDVKTKPGLTRFLPAACTFSGPTPEVALVPWQGSGDIAAMARANCFLVVPDNSDRIRAGETVRILLI